MVLTRSMTRKGIVDEQPKSEGYIYKGFWVRNDKYHTKIDEFYKSLYTIPKPRLEGIVNIKKLRTIDIDDITLFKKSVIVEFLDSLISRYPNYVELFNSDRSKYETDVVLDIKHLYIQLIKILLNKVENSHGRLDKMRKTNNLVYYILKYADILRTPPFSRKYRMTNIYKFIELSNEGLLSGALFLKNICPEMFTDNYYVYVDTSAKYYDEAIDYAMLKNHPYFKEAYLSYKKLANL
jgi:hypothetical protein